MNNHPRSFRPFSLLIYLFLIFYGNSVQGQCVGNLINNGSFTSPKGEFVVAPGWTGISTPDVNDAIGPLITSPGYNWTGTPVPSSDGGTWQNIFSQDEYILQTISVNPGQSYTLRFEYAAQGIMATGLTYIGPVGVFIYIDDVLVHTAPDDNTQFTWESDCFTFTPNTAQITLKLSASQFLYVAIDGMCLTPSANDAVDLGNDTTLCQGETLTLDATAASPATYLWQDNSTNPTYTVTKEGTYWVRVTDKCSVASDTIRVNYLAQPSVNLGEDTTLCTGNTLTLDAKVSGVTYQWQDNTTKSTYPVTAGGLYWVKVANICGAVADSINVVYLGSPSVDLGKDTTLCLGIGYVIDATSPGSTYTWQDHSTNPVYPVTEEGIYWVEVKNQCGVSSDTLAISIKDCTCNMYIPNAFSPNEDNINDEFSAISNCPFAEYSLLVFNRWGDKVFESHDALRMWDGTFKGQTAQAGVYAYVITYRFDQQSYGTLSGNISLVR